MPCRRKGQIICAFFSDALRETARSTVCAKKSRLKRGGGAAALPLDELAECIPAAHTTESQLEDAEIARVISTWLRTLSAEKRQLFVRRYWYFDSEAALCKRFGISRSKAASTLYRLRLELKAKLESEGIVL